MMGKMDDDTLNRMKRMEENNRKKDEEVQHSKYIISSDNVWNLYRNNFAQFVAIVYIFVCPYIIVSYDNISET